MRGDNHLELSSAFWENIQMPTEYQYQRLFLVDCRKINNFSGKTTIMTWITNIDFCMIKLQKAVYFFSTFKLIKKLRSFHLTPNNKHVKANLFAWFMSKIDHIISYYSIHCQRIYFFNACNIERWKESNKEWKVELLIKSTFYRIFDMFIKYQARTFCIKTWNIKWVLRLRLLNLNIDIAIIVIVMMEALLSFFSLALTFSFFINPSSSHTISV